MSRKKSRLLRPLIKTGIGALVGACIGLAATVIFRLSSGSTEEIAKAAERFARDNTVYLLALDVAVMLIVSLVTYYRVESLMKKKNSPEKETLTDVEEEYLECRMERAGTLATVCNHTMFLLLFVLVGAYLNVADKGGPSVKAIVALFLCGGFLFPIWEIVFVRQNQRWDPTKKGEPGDLKFTKQWLKSCDEGERQVIYQSGYRVFRATQNLLMALLGITFLSNLFWGTGLLAVVVVAIVSVFMTGASAVFSMRLSKSKLE